MKLPGKLKLERGRRGERARSRSRGAAMMVLALTLLLGAVSAPGQASTDAAVPPEVLRAPVIQGNAGDGQLLRADTGRWRADTVRRAVYRFQWRLCDAGGGAGCTDVKGATDRIYAVRHDDVGRRLAVVVTAVTSSGSTPATSAVTAPVAPAPAGSPAATDPPTVVGSPVVGATLTVRDGTWAGTQPIRVRHAWRSCTAAGSVCRDLVGNADTYVVRQRDLGHVLRVLVTAQNSVGTGNALSDPTPTVTLHGVEAPTATSEPVIDGTPLVGRVLRTTRGDWQGTTPLTFTYQWRRCQGIGAPDASDCRVIARAGRPTYVLRRADVGAHLRVRVSATNAVGSATSTSNPTDVVAAAPPAQVGPRVTGLPSIRGTAQAGATVTATSGSWSGTAPISFAYRWVRCGAGGGASDGSNCPAIPGATGTAYALTPSDVGARLRVRVTASNRAGSATAASRATSAIRAAAGPAAPQNTREPAISGTATQGQTLATTAGTWTGAAPISLSYQWVRCGADGGRADGSNCAVIPGATTTKYVLSAADVGRRIRSRVVARNAGGQQTAASNATPTVLAVASGPPRATGEPAISGATAQGQALTTTAGTWTGAAPVSLSYQWVRCGADGGRADGSNCAVIAGATTTKYALSAADVGSRLRVRVTGRNARGTSTVASNATGRIAGTEPELPSGAVRLPGGRYSIPVTSVSLPVRLVISGVSFRPNPVRTRRTTLELRVHVVDTRGYVVRNAMVFGRSTPLLTSPAGEQRTAMDGWAVLRMVPKASFPLRTGYNVQFFLRVRKPGDGLLAGVSTRRLVQVRTAR